MQIQAPTLNVRSLSAPSAAVVEATLPLLEAHGDQVTARMYERLFAAVPAARALFNGAHMVPGGQLSALAAAIVRCARVIDDPDALAGLVERIAHRHVAVGARSEHYPIVGQHLLLAVRDVAGEAATPEVMTGWEEAYGILAEAFMQREAQIRRAQENGEGSWVDTRAFVVARRIQEGPSVVSFELEPADGGALPGFLPGQYVTVERGAGPAGSGRRSYSLSSAPEDPRWRITVQAEPGQGTPAGRVSNELVDGVQEGDTLDLLAPLGTFTLAPGDDAVVLLGGGVGQTPLQSMLRHLVQANSTRSVVHLTAARSGAHHAFRAETRALAAEAHGVRTHVLYEAPEPGDRAGEDFDGTGRYGRELLAELLPAEPFDVHLCGPAGFMTAMTRDLEALGVPAERVRSEAFDPRP